MRRGQDDDRQTRIVEPQLAQKIESVRTGKHQIEQHQRAIGMARKRGQCLFSVRGRDDIETRIDMRKGLFERANDQRMVVHDQNLYCYLLNVANSLSYCVLALSRAQAIPAFIPVFGGGPSCVMQRVYIFM